MSLSINVGGKDNPYGLPVSVVDSETGEVKGFFKSVVDAHKARATMENNNLTVTQPDLFARCMVSLPPTLAW